MPFPTHIPPLSAPGFEVRRAIRSDVPAIAGLLLEDPVSAAREPLTSTSDNMDGYYAAFDDVDSDPRQFLAVIVDTASSTRSQPSSGDAGDVVGTAQLTLMPGLTRGGALRLQIEGVHVANRLQGRGIGSAMFAWADEVGRGAGAKFAQLTSDKMRADAHRFYERLGWVASHEGMKKNL